MKILQKLLNIILNFQLQLINDLWFENEKTKEIEHKSFSMLAETHKKFKNVTVFIFKSINSDFNNINHFFFTLFVFIVLQKNASAGYEMHLKNLELTLNFNNFYSRQSESNEKSPKKNK